MSVDPDTYLKAAEAMPQGGLSAIAGDAISDVAAARLFSKHVAFRENELFLGMQSGSVDGYNLRGAAAFDRFNKDLERRSADGKRARSFDDILHLALIDNLNAQIAFLDNKIAEGEKHFTDKYGDDWREDMALRYLDPDDFPERADGESMADYHRRLEDALYDKLYDENGNLRPGVAADPEKARLAEHLKYIKARRQAEADLVEANEIAADVSLNADERRAALEEKFEATETRDLEIGRRSGELVEEVQAVADATYDKTFDEAAVAASDVAMDNSGF
jgi:hypothetical protein